MKKVIFLYAIITTLLAGTILTGCDSPTPKVDDPQTYIQEPEEGLKEVPKEVPKESAGVVRHKTKEETWRTFKDKSELAIRQHDNRIAELKENIKKSEITLDSIYKENNKLNARIVAYEKNQSDWDLFKLEFNRDVDEIGKALKDFTVHNN